MAGSIFTSEPTATAEAPAVEWQPIETAPKDGTEFLAGRFTGDPSGSHEGLIEVDRWHSRSRGDEFDGPGNFNSRHWPATHWRPLPAPPDLGAPNGR